MPVAVACLLCALAALAALWRPAAAAVGPLVRCEPCDVGALLLCKPLPRECAERVREPGCGCCMTCALSEGQACGVYTARCGSGSACRHREGERRPLQALLEGRGVCSSSGGPRRASGRNSDSRDPRQGKETGPPTPPTPPNLACARVQDRERVPSVVFGPLILSCPVIQL